MSGQTGTAGLLKNACTNVSQVAVSGRSFPGPS
jgi:hypothetical protein